MHFAICATWGPTDPTRSALPFIFAASALQAGDTVTLMLFHDAVHMATQGTAEKLVPVGPPPRFEEVVSHAGGEGARMQAMRFSTATARSQSRQAHCAGGHERVSRGGGTGERKSGLLLKRHQCVNCLETALKAGVHGFRPAANRD